MSILQNFPDEASSLSLNFAQSKILDPRMTFSRAQTSNTTCTGSNGLVTTAVADEPRFHHEFNSTTNAVDSLGLLIEEQRTNLLRQSQNLDDTTYWSQTNIQVTANATVSPDGTTNAERIFDNASTGTGSQHWIRGRAIGVTAGAHVTASVFVKFDSTNLSIRHFALGVNDAETGGSKYAGIKLSTDGTATLTDSTDFAGITGGVIKYPNGWYRLYLSLTNDVITELSVRLQLNTSAGVSVYDGDGTSGVFVWGAQLEFITLTTGPCFPTSYIPTDTTSGGKTRPADVVRIDGENFNSQWFNPKEGTVFSDIKMVGVQKSRYDRIWSFTNTNFNHEGIGIYIAGPNSSAGGSGYVSSITIGNPAAAEQIGGTISITALNTPRLKSCFAFKQNDCCSAYNGTLIYQDNIASLQLDANPDRLYIGQPQRFQGTSCMTISQFAYYPKRLTNQQIQTLSKI